MPRKNLIIWTLAFVIAVNSIFIIFNILSRPTIAFDSVAMWSFKAKTLFYEGVPSFENDDILYLGGGGHINYPWHIPLSLHWLNLHLGEFNDLEVNIIFLFYYMASAGAIFFFLKPRAGIFSALLLSFFMSSMPLLFYHAHNSYADLPLSFYYLMSFIFMYKWLEGKKNANLILSGLFMAGALWTKNTGILLLISFLPMLIVGSTKKLRDILVYFSSLILPLIPWIGFNYIFNLGINDVQSGLGFHFEAIKNILGMMFIGNNWNIWAYFLILLLILNINKIIQDKKILLSWTTLAISSLLILSIHIFTEGYVFALNNQASSRNFMPIIMVSIVIAGLTIAKNHQDSSTAPIRKI